MKKLFLQQNKEKGITLIVLVVTIIVLLILAGVTITALIGENGILNRAADAKTQSDISQTKEQIKLELTTMTTEKDINSAGKYSKADMITAVKKVTGNDVVEYATTVKSKKGNDVDINDLWEGAIDYVAPDTATTILASKLEGKNVGDVVEWRPTGIVTQESVKSFETVNGHGDQTIYRQNTTWSILSRTDTEVTLVSSTTLGTASNGMGMFSLRGATGWLNAEDELNRICKALYGTRSLTAEDINIACGYRQSLKEVSTTSEIYFPQVGGTAYEGINNVGKGIYTKPPEISQFNYIIAVQPGAEARKVRAFFGYSRSAWLATPCVRVTSDGATFQGHFVSSDVYYTSNTYLFKGDGLSPEQSYESARSSSSDYTHN